MSGSTVPVALVLVLLGVLAAMIAPDLFTITTTLQSQTGVSAAANVVAGRAPVIFFALIAVVFTAIITVGARSSK